MIFSTLAVLASLAVVQAASEPKVPYCPYDGIDHDSHPKDRLVLVHSADPGDELSAAFLDDYAGGKGLGSGQDTPCLVAPGMGKERYEKLKADMKIRHGHSLPEAVFVPAPGTDKRRMINEAPQIIASQMFDVLKPDPEYMWASYFTRFAYGPLPEVNHVTPPPEDCRPAGPGDFVSSRVSTVTESGETLGELGSLFDARVQFLADVDYGTIPGLALGYLGICEGSIFEMSLPPHFAYGNKAVGKLPAHSTVNLEVEVNRVLPFEKYLEEKEEIKEFKRRQAQEEADRIALFEESMKKSQLDADAAEELIKNGKADTIKVTSIVPTEGRAGDYTDIQINGIGISDRDVITFVPDGTGCESGANVGLNYVDGRMCSILFEKPGRYHVCYRHAVGEGRDGLAEESWTEYKDITVTIQ